MIGAVLGLAQLGIGLYKQAQAGKENDKALNEQRKLNERAETEALRKKNSDVMQTAAVQGMLSKSKEFAQDNLAQARGIARVTGNNSYVADAMESSRKLVGDTARDIAMTNTDRQDKAQAEYMDVLRQNANSEIKYHEQKAQNDTKAAEMAIKAGAGALGSDLQSYLDNGKGMFETGWEAWKHRKDENTTTLSK